MAWRLTGGLVDGGRGRLRTVELRQVWPVPDGSVQVDVVDVVRVFSVVIVVTLELTSESRGLGDLDDDENVQDLKREVSVEP